MADDKAPEARFDTSDVDRWIGVPLGGGQMKDAVHVNPGGEAMVQLAGDSSWIDGVIGNRYGTSVSVPERLQDDLPGQQSGIYVRINLTGLNEGSAIVPGGQVRVRIPKS